jgi:hypothetical protein
MACACGKGTSSPRQTYVVTAPDGKRTSYSTEVEAKAAALRVGGTWRVQS